MTITIPENIADITLGQLQDYAKDPSKKINIFAGIPLSQINFMNAKDFHRIDVLIDKALMTEVPFRQRFFIGDIEFGFIPDLDNISFAEFVDLSKYGVAEDTLHNLMAILFRPITNKKGDCYDILPYNGTAEYAEFMKQTPMHVVSGALVFFWNLANVLIKATQKFSELEQARAIQPRTTSRILGGIQRLKNWLKITF